MSGISEKYRTSVLYSLFYGGQFVLLGIQLPFFAGWLAQKSFSANEIGLITGIALIARLAIGPGVAFWADHQHDERRGLRFVGAVFAIAGVMLVLAPSKLLITIAAALVIFTFGLLVPLTDTAALRADRNGYLNYGQTRAIGSTAFLLTTILGGWLISRTGIGATGVVMALASISTFVLALTLPGGVGGRGGSRPQSWRDAPRLVSHPIFLGVLLSAGLTQGAHAVYYAFSYLRWSELGYAPVTIGFLWSVGVLAEIILLTKVRRLVRRMAPLTLLAIGAGGAAVRWFIIAQEPSVAILFIVQIMHALTFAATYIGTLEFLDRATPVRLLNTGMTLMSTTGVGAVTGLATVISGYIWVQAGPGAAYLMMSAMGAVAFALALITARGWDGQVLFD